MTALHRYPGATGFADAAVNLADLSASAVAPAMPPVVLNNSANIGKTHSYTVRISTTNVFDRIAYSLSFVTICCVVFSAAALARI